ncbi:thiamine phosphate synthase [Nocardioides rubriscoriae]|uniref:thiamine phosphate synthase n=1 Tax=Nocardioides rubriscoriae TaxID=642762 RepID=UPI0011DFDC05|nr:thiamine phosphate synthase [Nocardioides rubriscoriae]
MLPRFHLITDLPVLDRASLERLLAVLAGHDGALAGRPGVDAVQVRAKRATDREVVAWTRDLVAAVRPHGVRVIVNDRLDLALAAGADGVHLGHDDLAVADARALAPASFLVGATCRGPAQAARARADGADYAGVGPVHASSTKQGLPDPLGLDVLAAAAREIAAVAIGGITRDRVADVMATGAHGVAVVAAVWADPDPPRAAREIAELVHAA